MLLLVTPNDTTSTTEFRPVTLANYRNCVSLYIESKIAELPTEPKTVLKTGRLMRKLDVNFDLTMLSGGQVDYTMML